MLRNISFPQSGDIAVPGLECFLVASIILGEELLGDQIALKHMLSIEMRGIADLTAHIGHI